MHDFDTVDKANKIVWVLELLKSNTLLWATFPKTITVGTNLDLFLRSNFSKQMIPNFHILPQFYKDMLLNWIEFTNDKNNTSSSHHYAHLISWYKLVSYMVINSPMAYFNNRLFQAGLWFVSDLFYDNDKLIPFSIWMKRGVLAQDYLTWRGLVTIVRQKSVKYVRNDSNEEDKPLVNSYKEIIISSKPQLFEKIKAKQIKYVFTERALHQVKYKNKIYYNAIYGQTMSSNWEDIFKMPYINAC